MKAFVAYPGSPPVIGQCIEAGKDLINANTNIDLETWREVDNWGQPLVSPILQKIRACDFLIADITRINFNVIFEVGYAIGSSKRVLLTVNSGIKTDVRKYDEIGIFDTLGHKRYENSEEFADLFSGPIVTNPIAIPPFKDTVAPWYVLETPARSDAMGKIISCVKEARLRYRSFRRSESARLPPTVAIGEVAKSLAVIVPLASSQERDAEKHNVRAAFIAGLALGMERTCLILQSDDGPAPMDIRDDISTYRALNEIDGYISRVGYRLYDELRNRPPEVRTEAAVIATMSIGDPVAENEFGTLGNYYIRTSEFERARRGELDVLTGRKGTGKTALFSQLRDDVRRFPENVVVDLKPEGYQLIKLKEDVLSKLSQGSRDHLITAFWEYLLYMEIAHTLLDKDAHSHLRDPELFDKYTKLKEIYERDEAFAVHGDFSERLSSLANNLTKRFQAVDVDGDDGALSRKKVTELLHSQEIQQLRNVLINYLDEKGEVWVLFDNLDKGWSPGGIDDNDVFILRCLLNAANTMQNDVRREIEDFNIVIFLRNDVYELVVRRSADFGKEIHTSLDWKDKNAVANILLRRINIAVQDTDSFNTNGFDLICVSEFKGRSSLDVLISLSLMRPRNLLQLFEYCRGIAINRGHDRILEDDIEEGRRVYSDDLLVDLGNELRDVCPEAEDVLYQFIAEKHSYSLKEISGVIQSHGVASGDTQRVIDYLLYYGAFGVSVGDHDPLYIFESGYDMKKLAALAAKSSEARYVMHPALRPALGIEWNTDWVDNT